MNANRNKYWRHYFFTPLHVAAANAREAIFHLLLQHGATATINQRDTAGHTPLDLAIKCGSNEREHELEHVLRTQNLGSRDIQLIKEDFLKRTNDRLARFAREYQNRMIRSAEESLAFAMIMHPRLGAHAPGHILPQNVVQQICSYLLPSPDTITPDQAPEDANHNNSWCLVQ